MKLKKIKSVQLAPLAPFDFNSTFHKPDHFTSSDNFWESGIRWQTWYWEGKQLGIKFINLGTVKKPKVKIDIYHAKKLDNQFIDSLIKEIRYRFNFDLDLTNFYNSLKNDKYEYLIIGIVLQNATVKRSSQMFQALLENYGRLLEYDGHKLWCFWRPGGLKKISEDDLRALKVGYRAKSIKKIDESFIQGKINELILRKKNKESQKQELLDLYGVGTEDLFKIVFQSQSRESSFSRKIIKVF